MEVSFLLPKNQFDLTNKRKTFNTYYKRRCLFFSTSATRTELGAELDQIDHLNEVVVNLVRQLNLEVVGDDIRELLESLSQ